MTTLNHANLTTYDVPALSEFFRSLFGFHMLEARAGKFAVLRNEDGFLLTLMHDRRMTPENGYPGMFHIGFLQASADAVDHLHADLNVHGYSAPTPATLQRGGPPTYGFYCEAPGGVLVEVSTGDIPTT
ncbi:MAG TPA: VOC family protein [Edaphobacter sp.]